MTVAVDSLPLEAMQISTASRFWERFVGLLGRRALADEEALFITPCNNVHTFFMRFTIDVVFVDKQGVIVAIVPRLRPWRVAIARAGYSCLELAAGGAARFGLEPGQRLPKLGTQP